MRREASYLADIVDAVDSIRRIIGSYTRDEFLGSETLNAAVLQRLIVIGEAAAHVTIQLRTRYPDVPWREVIAFRNFAVHGYFDLDWETVWDTATIDAPELRRRIAEILSQEYPDVDVSNPQ